MPAQPPQYKTRAKVAQEAHEAIRPTSVWRTPEQIKAHLSRDQYRLYDLIWRRFVASQTVPAVYDTTSADVVAGHPESPLRLAVGDAPAASSTPTLADDDAAMATCSAGWPAAVVASGSPPRASNDFSRAGSLRLAATATSGHPA